MLSDLCGPTSSQDPANPTHRNEQDECGEYNWFLAAEEVELKKKKKKEKGKKCEKINYLLQVLCTIIF